MVSLEHELDEARMRRLRRCKIVATLGPATASSATVSAMFHADADLFRINMSHATHDQLRTQVGMIRALQEQITQSGVEPAAELMSVTYGSLLERSWLIPRSASVAESGSTTMTCGPI
jgi:Pyruvate kinase, barrel domain